MNTHERRVQNILAMYGAATDTEREAGLRWYEAARSLARALAETHWGPGRPRTLKHAAGIIAAVSPNVSWSRNVQIATLAFKDGYASGTFTRNCEKADRILTGEDPMMVLSGPKVTNFYLNILSAGENNSVTIDRHAVHIAEGRIFTDHERTKMLRINGTYNGYGEFVDAYREAAWRVNLSAAKLQAIVWVAYRNTLEGRVR